MTPAATPAPSALRPGSEGRELADPRPGRRAGATWVALTALAAGLVASIVMAAWLMFNAEVASSPTPVDGIQSSTWTPLTGITAFFFGVDAFHGSFWPLSILFGLFMHLVVGLLVGAVGVALIAYTFAGRPGVVGAAIFGVAYALFVQVIARLIVVNNLQDVHTVSDALPSWGWWIAHALYGGTLGVVAALMLSVGAPGVTPRGEPAEEPRP